MPGAVAQPWDEGTTRRDSNAVPAPDPVGRDP